MSFDASAYWEKRLRENFNQRGVGDIGLSRSYNAILYKVRRRAFRRAVSTLPLRLDKARVADIGSGTGFYLREWIGLGVTDLSGFDIAESAVARLRGSLPNVPIACGDISDPKATAENRMNDVVSAFDVLFHIVDDGQYRTALVQIAKMLRPGGWFLYSENLVSEEARKVHYVSRPESQILDALDGAGFRIVKTIPTFVLMNDPVRAQGGFLPRWFSRVYRVAGRGERWGSLIGHSLYPFEIFATSIVRRGPSTEILICQLQ